MYSDLRLVVEGVLLAYAALLPIVNPLGSAPIFLAITRNWTPELRASIAWRVAINAFILMLGSLLVGVYVLDFFGLSVSVVQVGGGLLVCGVSWQLLQDDDTSVPVPTTAAAKPPSSLAFYPLTLPLTVGPGAMSVAITIGANHTSDVRMLVIHAIGHVLGVLLVAATIFICFRYADRIARVLGETGTSIVLRLSAFIMLCIGVEIVWNGASHLLASLPLAPAR